MPDRLLIRADATTASGTGHVMRCLALAQEWQRNSGEIIFAQAETTSAVERRLRTEGLELLRVNATPGSADDVNQTIRFARQHNATWIVVDGYHFDAEYQHRIKEAGLRLLILDDYGHAKHYWADYVLNQNLSADPKLYSNREPYTQLLLGTKYVLLRKDFEKWRNWKRTIPPVARKVLVTLGGSDPDNVTGKVIDALNGVKNGELECVVVVGGSNPHVRELEQRCKNSNLSIRLVVDSTDMPARFAAADLAIIIAGTTLWEALFLGVPLLSYFRTSLQNQSISLLAERHAVLPLGRISNFEAARMVAEFESLLVNASCRRSMSESGRKIVDGIGSRRIAALLA